jgi:hypothetical protein
MIRIRCIAIRANTLYIVALLCLLGVSCQDVGVVPDYMKPGRRDYVWTVDTLKVAPGDFVYPSRIWGASPNDVWLACDGSPGTLWHFDGMHWTRDSKANAVRPSSLWGTAPSDVWLGNFGNSYWHYNGLQWSKFSDVTGPAGYEVTSIEDIWGEAPNDLWGVGFAETYQRSDAYKAIIMHFDGSSWQYKPIPDLHYGFTQIRRHASTGVYLLAGWRPEPTGDTLKVFSYDRAGALQELCTDPELGGIYSIRGEVYVVLPGKIFKYRNRKLELWKDFSGTQYFARMVGRSELDFFGQTRDNSIIHYNGTDMQVLFHNTMDMWLAYVVGDSAFFVCNDLDRNLTIIIRGRPTS